MGRLVGVQNYTVKLRYTQTMSAFLLSQLLAGVALACNLLSFQFRSRRPTLVILTFAVAAVSAHLWVLGEEAGALLTAYAIVYFLTSVFTTSRTIMSVFLFGAGILFYLSFERPLDWLVMVSTAFTLFSLYSPTKKRMQEYQFVGTLTRIVYYSIIFSPVALLLEAALFLSNAIGYWRFYIRKGQVDPALPK